MIADLLTKGVTRATLELYFWDFNAAGLNFMACAFETTGAICKEVTPLIDRIARNSRISRSR
jgi:hypothetical protein